MVVKKKTQQKKCCKEEIRSTRELLEGAGRLMKLTTHKLALKIAEKTR